MDVSYTRHKRFLLYLFYDNFILVGCTYKRYIHNCSIAFKEGLEHLLLELKFCEIGLIMIIVILSTNQQVDLLYCRTCWSRSCASSSWRRSGPSTSTKTSSGRGCPISVHPCTVPVVSKFLSVQLYICLNGPRWRFIFSEDMSSDRIIRVRFSEYFSTPKLDDLTM